MANKQRRDYVLRINGNWYTNKKGTLIKFTREGAARKANKLQAEVWTVHAMISR